MAFASIEQYRAVTSKNVLNMQAAKEAGAKVVGQFCLYAPLEVILAAGAIPVSLCGTRGDYIPDAEKHLPAALCPRIKSTYGFALQDACPYLAAADVLVADISCDSKKKVYELLAAHKPLLPLYLPHTQDSAAVAFVREQYATLLQELGTRFGTRVSDDTLRSVMDLYSRLHRALKDVLDLARRDPSPLTGMNLLDICFRLSYMPDPVQGISLLQAIHDEVAASPAPEQSTRRPRLLLTGVPNGLGCQKSITMLENCGASVVCIDNCTCYKKLRFTDVGAADPLQELAKRYMRTPCAIMWSDPQRYTTLRELCASFTVDGVVDLSWQGCQPYMAEAYSVRRFVEQELHLPCLTLVSDYSDADNDSMQAAAEAFVSALQKT